MGLEEGSLIGRAGRASRAGLAGRASRASRAGYVSDGRRRHGPESKATRDLKRLEQLV
ncbi:MAG TPA: hypothetical protein PLI41_04035 [Bacteroidales bacterium]|nr:hypothetical protein [Bacteroidales bacterium]HPY67236.1 hypothetical protein [Bacteroidales bacterium]HQB36697.1 hypothetical protein [Bacteroidales bacterium]